LFTSSRRSTSGLTVDLLTTSLSILFGR